MVPIHDTDLGQERWSQAEWEHYELWEKIEQRIRRRKWFWIVGTAVLFLILSAVPIVIDRWPKWQGLSLARRLAHEINGLKREASREHFAYRIRFAGGRLAYVIEKSASCADRATTPVREGQLGTPEEMEQFALLSPAQGDELAVPGLIESFCYDYLSGSEGLLKGEALLGFGVIPVKDLTERRMDRLTVLLLKGPSAEISFE